MNFVPSIFLMTILFTIFCQNYGRMVIKQDWDGKLFLCGHNLANYLSRVCKDRYYDGPPGNTQDPGVATVCIPRSYLHRDIHVYNAWNCTARYLKTFCEDPVIRPGDWSPTLYVYEPDE